MGACVTGYMWGLWRHMLAAIWWECTSGGLSAWEISDTMYIIKQLFDCFYIKWTPHHFHSDRGRYGWGSCWGITLWWTGLGHFTHVAPSLYEGIWPIRFLLLQISVLCFVICWIFCFLCVSSVFETENVHMACMMTDAIIFSKPFNTFPCCWTWWCVLLMEEASDWDAA